MSPNTATTCFLTKARGLKPGLQTTTLLTPTTCSTCMPTSWCSTTCASKSCRLIHASKLVLWHLTPFQLTWQPQYNLHVNIHDLRVWGSACLMKLKAWWRHFLINHNVCLHCIISGKKPQPRWNFELKMHVSSFSTASRFTTAKTIWLLLPEQGARTEHLSVSSPLRWGWFHHPPGDRFPHSRQHLPRTQP